MSLDNSKFINVFNNFTTQTILGIYMSLYRIKKNIDDYNIRLILLNQYLNDCYKNLILQDDTYIITIFNNMQKLSGYSPLCLLHHVMIISKIIVESLNDITCFILLPEDILRQRLSILIWLIVNNLTNKVFKNIHICDGPKTLMDYNPNEPLFFLSEHKLL